MFTTECRRCGGVDGWQTELVGAYHAFICPDCLNDWHRYLVDGRAEYQAYVGNEEEIAILLAGMPVEDRIRDLRALYVIKHGLERKLFDIAAAWCTTPIKREA